MKKDRIWLLQDWGCDTQAALERLDGDREFYLECTEMFCTDENFAQLSAALDSGHTEEAFRCAHTLKGVAINFGLLPLLDAISEVVEPLRAGDMVLAKAKHEAFSLKKAQYDAIVMDTQTNE